nr:TolC family protein [Acanthopleuribacter pedis]
MSLTSWCLLGCLWLQTPEPEMTLQHAIETALQQNRDLQRAHLDLQNAQSRVLLAKDSFRWQFSSGVSYSKTDETDAGGVFSVDASKKLRTGTELDIATDIDLSEASEDRFDTDYSVTLTQPLLQRGGRAFHERDLRFAERGLATSEDSLRRRAQNTVLAVVRAYFDVRFQEQTIIHTRKSLERLEKILDATEIKLNIGRVSQVDLYRVRLSKNRTELNLNRNATDLEFQYRRFSDLLGLSTSARFQLAPVDLPMPEVVSVDPLPLLERRRVQITHRRLERDYHQARLDLKLSKQATLPDLNLVGRYFVSDIQDVAAFDGETDHGSTISLSNRYSFNQRRNRVNVRLAKNRLRQIELDLTDFQMQYEREVLDRLRSLAFLEKEVDLSEQNLLFSRQQLEVAEIRFERGIIDSFDVIEAEENVLNAANTVDRAKRDLILAWLSLKIFTNQLDPDSVNVDQLLAM